VKSKHWIWLLAGYLVGSYFGLSKVTSMFGSKK
jgi:hypothetical protein